MKSSVASVLVRVLSTGVFAVLFAGLSGCSSAVYDVKVDAIQNPEVATGFSYRIVDKDGARVAADPYHVEAMEVVRAALAGRGMYESIDPAEAEVEVIVDYGVGPQRIKVENFDPRFEPTVSRAPLALLPVRKADGSIGYAAIPAEKLDIDGTYRGLPVLRGAHVYEKYLTITARETSAWVGGARKPVEAWQVQATVEDQADRLEGYLPVLAGAVVDYLGTNTEKKQRLRLRGDSEVVAFVKGSR